jgi:hypothetical protein
VRNDAFNVVFIFGDPPLMPDICSEVGADEELPIVLPESHRLAGLARDRSEEAFVVALPGYVFLRAAGTGARLHPAAQ